MSSSLAAHTIHITDGHRGTILRQGLVPAAGKIMTMNGLLL
ncbi:hypothetical protein RSOL_412250 [Rhizoctonia solani AG-3 Rhs1AP]|uniref:Uncharacterized protein n=1 Tax=Rhizoctonia solani AG-3 Rhs1AP TaxID=1086054 RepID=X8JEB9_9AGAM|nr:hypothetical protein RSOL_412250 [Rhizoctonia solani AG-3 Rhs1AP]